MIFPPELLETYNYIQEGVLFAIVYFYFLQFREVKSRAKRVRENEGLTIFIQSAICMLFMGFQQ